MGMKEKNKIIISKIRNEIARRGLVDKLDVYPVENAFTKRRRYWRDDLKNVNIFKVHMWDLNKLEDTDLDVEINSRIDQAQQYFGL